TPSRFSSGAATYIQRCPPTIKHSARPRRRFNTAVPARAKESTELGYLASPVTGGGIRVDRLTQLYLLAKAQDGANPAEHMAKMAMGSGHFIEKDGKKLDPDEMVAALATQATQVEKQTLPLLNRLGIG